MSTHQQLASGYLTFGHILRRQGHPHAARCAFEQALVCDAYSVEAHYHLAHLLERTQQLAEAERVLQQGIELAPHNLDLHIIAARIERQRGQYHLALQRLTAFDLALQPQQTAMKLHYELGFLYDLLQQPDIAFGHFVHANDLAAVEACAQGLDKTRVFAPESASRQLLSAAWVATWSEAAATATATPIFIIGFPRSGTTLLGHILDSHPRLHTMIEREAVPAMLRHVRTLPQGYPAALADLSGAQIEELRAIYEHTVARSIKHKPDVAIVDEYPFNLMLTPLIVRVFPDARFLLVIRHPCDVCLSAFMQNFALNGLTAHFTSLEDTAHAYARMMGFWQQLVQVYNLHVHTVKYEELTANFTDSVRRICTFLEVPWDDAVQDFHQHGQDGREIETPSYHQVVKPIYHDSVYRWQRYTHHMTDVFALLAPFVTAFGYPPLPG
jgi:tetratricopeptide (TPR) repeat protein